MEQLEAVVQYIGENESLFSGIAAIIAIIGVCFAVFDGLRRRLMRKDEPASASGSEVNHAPTPIDNSVQQDIHYTRNPSGHKLAWSLVGEGPPLVRALGWFTNLDFEWRHPASRRCIDLMAANYRVLRYDARGMGMSERDVTEVSAATRLQDLEAVIEASGLERFILWGLSEGGTTAIQYAAKHPERVSHLVLWGSFLKPVLDEEIVRKWMALLDLIPSQWGSSNRAFRQMMTAQFIPDGDAEQNEFFNELQRHAAQPEVVVNTVMSINDIDVSDIASQVTVPTLVMHRVDDLLVPIHQSIEIAATIPGAKLVQLQGANHWMLSDARAFREIVEQVDQFVR